MKGVEARFGVMRAPRRGRGSDDAGSGADRFIIRGRRGRLHENKSFITLCAASPFPSLIVGAAREVPIRPRRDRGRRCEPSRCSPWCVGVSSFPDVSRRRLRDARSAVDDENLLLLVRIARSGWFVGPPLIPLPPIYPQAGLLALAVAHARSLTIGRLALFLPAAYYLVFSYMDGSEYREGKPWPWLQRWKPMHRIIGDGGYFKPRIIYDDEDALKRVERKGPEEEQCIFGCFPHGVVSFHHGILMTDTAGFLSKFPSLVRARRDLVASVTLAVPGYRELLMWLGCVDAGKATAKRVLRKGYHLYVLPGGEAEQMLTKRGRHRVFVKARKGFVKLALERGANLVPVYAFGETDMYHTSDAFMGPRKWLMKNLRVALPLFWGRWGTPIPYPGTLAVVVGKPIRAPTVTDPEKMHRAVDTLHAEFVEQLRGLFERHKAECGYPDAVLEVF